MTPVTRIAAADASLAEITLAPLGVALRVRCPGSAVPIVEAACRGWEGRAARNSPALRLRIETSPGLSGTGRAEIRGGLTDLTVRGPGVSARAELRSGFADSIVSAEYLADPAALRDEVLEPLVLMLLTRRDRTPFHAAAFIADGLAILLAGRSGAGKSCLAQAADAAGYQVLSEDTVYVQRAPGLAVWGWPTVAHLLAADAPGTAGPTRTRGGRVKRVVPLRSASQSATACRRAVLCVLARADGDATLRPIPAARVYERLWPLDEGFDLLPVAISASIDRLCARGAWELRLSSDPAEAVRVVAAALPRLKATAAE